ncbi:hypothetical protein [Chitinophaga silvisoli]|uniref:Uncharacterized protein n=1 Tax=Chitinophaga silvisoli TaxID=2291814 RepID=A0A3E1P2L0_9BACT|nr:hypothetical protein [Chitinophaga silvisoli]RFM34421.1 hypothetical protein DXN04_14160 [Chitinophaga silvisoli]
MKKDTEVKVNPLEEELQRWNVKEQLYQKTLGASTTKSREYLKIKYKHFRNLYQQFKNVKDKDVKASLKIIKAHLRATRKQLYPLWQRLSVDIARAVWNMATWLFKNTRDVTIRTIGEQRQRVPLNNSIYDATTKNDNTQDLTTAKDASQSQSQRLLKIKRKSHERAMLNVPRMGKGIS